MSQNAYKAAAERRLNQFQSLMQLVAARFQTIEDETLAVRRDDVAKYVALRLRRRVSVQLRNDVADACTILLGFERTSREGRALYVGVRDIESSEEAQREASKALLSIRRYG